MLDRQVVHVPFAKGLDTQPDPHQLEIGSLLTCENGIFETPKKIKKRNGYSTYARSKTGGGSISAGTGIYSDGDSLQMRDGSGHYVWNAAIGSWTAVTGVSRDMAVSTHRMTAGAASMRALHAATNGAGVTCVVYETIFAEGQAGEARDLWCSIVDEATGDTVSTARIGTAGNARQHPRVIWFPARAKFLVGFFDFTDNYYRIAEINAATAAVTNITNVRATTASADYTDSHEVVRSDANSRAYLLVGCTDGLGRVQCHYVDATLTVSAATAVDVSSVTAAPANMGGWVDASGNVWCAFGASLDRDVGYFVRAADLSSVLAVTAIETGTADPYVYAVGGAMVNATTAIVSVAYATSCSGTWDPCTYVTPFYRPFLSRYPSSVRCYTATVSGTVGTPLAVSGAALVAPPVIYGTEAVIAVEASSNTGAGRICILAVGTSSGLYSTPRLLSTGNYGNTIVCPTTRKTTSASIVVGHTSALLPASTGLRLVREMTVKYATVSTPELNQATIVTWMPSTSVPGDVSQGVALVCSGVITQADGYAQAELGFLAPPVILSASQSTPGAAPRFASTGDYGFIAVLEYTDATGAIYRSAPSVSLTYNVTALNTVTLSVMVPRLTDRVIASSSLVIYVTAAAGQVYYRSAEYSIASMSGEFALSPIVYEPRVGSEVLYTNTGEIENIQPPPSHILARYKSRVLLVPDEAPTSIWYSKAAAAGQPVDFSDAFVLNVDPLGGGITAIAQMDDKCIVFKRGRIFYFVGEGPAVTGADNDFSPPLLITADVGAVDWRSVVSMPAGLMFKSDKGIYLLDRALSIQYVGSGVEAYNAQTVTSVVLSADTREVRFTLGNGTALVFNFNFNAWSVFTNVAGVSATIWTRKWVFLKSDGTACVETPGAYLDGATPIAVRLKTSWWVAAAIQGFQRFRRLLLMLTPNGTQGSLTVSVYQDYQTAAPVQVSSVAYTVGGNVTDAVQTRIHMTRQKCKSMQVEIIETPAAAGDSGTAFSGLAFEVGVKRGTSKIAADASV